METLVHTPLTEQVNYHQRRHVCYPNSGVCGLGPVVLPTGAFVRAACRRLIDQLGSVVLISAVHRSKSWTGVTMRT
jgi:hypothetical protein